MRARFAPVFACAALASLSLIGAALPGSALTAGRAPAEPAIPGMRPQPGTVSASCAAFTSGIRSSYETAYRAAAQPGYRVVAVRLAQIAEACRDARVVVTLSGPGTSAVLAVSPPVPVPRTTAAASSTSMSVPFNAPLHAAAAAVAQVSLEFLEPHCAAGASFLGTSGADRLTGSAGADCLDGGSGADRLYGQGGDDMLLGGAGVDMLDGGAGDDVLTGGTENDVVLGGDGNDSLFSGLGGGTLDGGPGLDTCVGLRGQVTYRNCEVVVE